MTRRFTGFLAFATSALVLPATLAAQCRDGSRPPCAPELNAATDPLLRGLRWRSIGPSGQGGRLDDIAVVERNTSIYYLGFATAGVWKTVNNGVTFTPIFDTYSTHSIGDIGIAQSNPDVVYVGTGEANNRQSASFGDGMFKTTDGGKTFTPIGLKETQSIARVVVHPANPDLVLVAAPGHLFGPNPERGVFRSADGGKTWTKVLYVDENTGATDLVMHPKNPSILFAATYTRRRTSCCFVAGGPGDGIWKSVDGGVKWTRVTGGGLPGGTMGRIALDFSRSNPNVIYAQIEVAPDKLPVQVGEVPEGRGGGAGGGEETAGGGRGGANLPPDKDFSGIWRSSDGGRTWEFRGNENQRPMYFSQLRVDPNNENTIYVGGVQAMKSVDGGKTFEDMQAGMGHVDHHAIWIDPANSDHVMYGNDGSLDVSYDGGKNWESPRNWAIGQAYHASADMRRPYFICTGLQDNNSWCGPSSVRTGPILAQDWYRVSGGDGFQSQIDPTDYTVLYAESQGGNMARLDLRTGAQVNVRPRDGGRGGRAGFADVPAGAAGPGATPPNVVPAPTPGTQYRYNWQTPIVLSPHDASTVFVGANRLFISRDRGRTWTTTIDLTKDVNRDQREFLGVKYSLPGCSRARQGSCILSRNDGVSQYSTIETIAESPIVKGLIWVGTDDGNIQVTRDGGATWTEVGKNVPGGTHEYYVSRVEASRFDAGTAYASLDGHRHDDQRPYVYVTRDYGQTWASIAGDLPARGNVNSVKQDPRNRALLYAATEYGFFVSFDEGRAWKPFMTSLPVVRVDDVIIHPRENDLILSTHGRSIWIMDDVSPLQQMNATTLAQDVVLFEPRNAVLWKPDIRLGRSVTGATNFRGENAPPGTAISYYLKNAASGDVKITIRDIDNGQVFRTITGTRAAGLNRVQWDLCSDPRPAPPDAGRGGGGGGGGCGGGGRGGGGGGGRGGPQMIAQTATPGSFLVTLSVNGRDYSKSVTVLEDVWMNER